MTIIAATCQVYDIGGDRETRCGNSATTKLLVTCIHEHLYLDDFCAEHAARFLNGHAMAYCDLCWIGTQFHRCEAVLREVTCT